MMRKEHDTTTPQKCNLMLLRVILTGRMEGDAEDRHVFGLLHISLGKPAAAAPSPKALTISSMTFRSASTSTMLVPLTLKSLSCAYWGWGREKQRKYFRE